MTLLPLLLLIVEISISRGQELPRDPSPIIYPGQVNVGLLTSIHNPTRNGTNCGRLRQGAVLQAMAAVWAAQQVNFRKEPHELNIGIYIYDTCGLENIAMRQLYRLVTHVGHVQPASCVDKRIPPIFGRKISFFRAIVTTLIRFELWDVAVIVADEQQRQLGNAFWEEAELAGIRVITVELPVTTENEVPITESMLDILDTYKASPKGVVALLSPHQAIKLLKNFDPEDAESLYWLIVTPIDISTELKATLNPVQLNLLSKVFMLSPNSIYIKEYHSYFRQLLTEEESLDHPLVAELVKKSNLSLHKDPLDLKKHIHVEEIRNSSLERDVSNTVKAIWSLAAAMKNVQNRICRRGTDCLLYLRKSLSSYINRAIRNVGYTLHGTGASALDGNKLHFSKDGFLSTTRYVLRILNSGESQEIGWYSDDSGLVIDPNVLGAIKKFDQTDLYRNHLSQSSLRSVSLTSHHEPKMNHPRANVIPEESKNPPVVISEEPKEEIIDVRDIKESNLASWIGRPWALTILGLSAVGVLFALYVLVFLLVKMCEGTLKKSNLLLGILQILSVLSLYGAATLLLFKPSSFICGLQRLVPNVAYSYCFGVLLLKSMHLRSQKTIGLGGSVSNLNQVLTLLFIVGLQLALEVQWWILRPPFIVVAEDEVRCVMSRGDILLSQVYIVVLLLLVVLTTLSVHNVPYNYTEGKSLIATSVICLAVFIGWAVACWMLTNTGDRHIAASLAPIATAAAVLIGIFCPQLYAIHKYGVFPHKKLSYTDSLSTVFSVFKEVDQATGRGKKGAKTLETRTAQGKRNPAFYDDFASAYP
ncbi:uncharacterized protein LOC111622554 [Centruroides sculpturatus]|uniref:uncharacterized protein LOC111622554 n=1 Tax=Centruroides sculpturatus TaxID=218467 RepID=UPI000C6E43E9|nr:uncharacterized protein LOC111622554 [Centruroides sculpturatus]